MNIHPRKQAVIDVWGRDPETLDELAQCAIKVLGTQKHRRYSDRDPSIPIKVLGFSWDIAYRQVSNTHHCPLDGKTNWGGNEPNLPRSYPGWFGRVWVRYSSDASSDPFPATRTHTGTGGGGSYDGPWKRISSAQYNKYGHKRTKNMYPSPCIYSWDYRFFDSDWPNLNKGRIFDILKGNTGLEPHKFLREDPETVERDY